MTPFARAAALLMGAALAAAAPSPAAAKPKPEETLKVVKPPEIRYPAALPLLRRDERLPEGYQQMVRKLMLRGPADTLGDGVFAMAEEAFHDGAFDVATAR